MKTLFLLLAISPLFRIPTAAQQPSSPPPTDDPFVWLEDIEGSRSMEWVNAKNAVTIAALTRSPLYQTFYDRIKQILDSKDRSPTRRSSGTRSTTSGRTPNTSAASGGAPAGRVTRPRIRRGKR